MPPLVRLFVFALLLLPGSSLFAQADSFDLRRDLHMINVLRLAKQNGGRASLIDTSYLDTVSRRSFHLRPDTSLIGSKAHFLWGVAAPEDSSGTRPTITLTLDRRRPGYSIKVENILANVRYRPDSTLAGALVSGTAYDVFRFEEGQLRMAATEWSRYRQSYRRQLKSFAYDDKGHLAEVIVTEQSGEGPGVDSIMVTDQEPAWERVFRYNDEQRIVEQTHKFLNMDMGLIDEGTTIKEYFTDSTYHRDQFGDAPPSFHRITYRRDGVVVRTETGLSSGKGNYSRYETTFDEAGVANGTEHLELREGLFFRKRIIRYQPGVTNPDRAADYLNEKGTVYAQSLEVLGKKTTYRIRLADGQWSDWGNWPSVSARMREIEGS